MSGRTRLAALLAVVLGPLITLEGFGRVWPTYLAALSHRVRFKLALLERKGPVDVVVLGSSRSNDGVNPSALGLGRGFSAATPSSSLPTLRYVADAMGPQRLVLLEVSRPMFVDAPLEAAERAGPSDPESDDGHDPLGLWLKEHSVLLRSRRALALENLPRLVGLAIAPSLDGSEWLRTRFLLESLRSTEPPPDVHDDAAWVADQSVIADLPTDPETMRIVDGYTAASARLRSKGARIILVAPPVGSGWRGDECQPEPRALRSAVARSVDAPFLDFTCAPVDDRWFVDGQHLSAPGRLRYSQILGAAVRALP